MCSYSTKENISMKTMVLVASGVTLALTSAAVAQYVGPSAVNTPTTVKQIVDDPREDQYVRLEGKLIRKLTADTYVFEDATGAIEVEIEPEMFPRTAIDQTTVVVIQGEVDRRTSRAPEIEVDRISVR